LGKRLITYIAFAILLGCFNLGMASEETKQLTNANVLYEGEKYEEALEQYLDLVVNNFESASLYYNIGNCYIKENKFGFAILYYLKAEKLDPSDEEIKTNLAFARQFMPTQLEGVRINPVNTFFDSIVGPYTLESMAWVTSVIFILTMLLISYVIFLRYNNIGSRIGIYIFAILLVSTSILTTYKYRTDDLTKTGVIVSDEATVYSSPNENGEVEFVGAYGIMIEIEKSKDDFYLVSFENKRKGWVKKIDVGVI